MRIAGKSADTLVVNMFQIDYRPRIMEDGSIGLPAEDPIEAEAVEQWIGDDMPAFVRMEDGTLLDLDHMLVGFLVPTPEVSVERSIPFDMVNVFETFGGSKLMGIINMTAAFRASILKWGGIPPDVDAHNKRMDELLKADNEPAFDVAVKMMYGGALADLLVKIGAKRSEMLGKCKKVIEFYIQSPALICSDNGKKNSLGCVAFAQYGIVGFGRKEQEAVKP